MDTEAQNSFENIIQTKNTDFEQVVTSNRTISSLDKPSDPILSDWIPTHGAITESEDIENFLSYAKHGRLADIYHLAKNMTNINALGKNGYSALHNAVIANQKDAVRMIIDLGANVNVQDRRNGYTPLHLACMKWKVEMVRLLMSWGADPKLAAHDGTVPGQQFDVNLNLFGSKNLKEEIIEALGTGIPNEEMKKANTQWHGKQCFVESNATVTPALQSIEIDQLKQKIENLEILVERNPDHEKQKNLETEMQRLLQQLEDHEIWASRLKENEEYFRDLLDYAAVGSYLIVIFICILLFPEENIDGLDPLSAL